MSDQSLGKTGNNRICVVTKYARKPPNKEMRNKILRGGRLKRSQQSAYILSRNHKESGRRLWTCIGLVRSQNSSATRVVGVWMSTLSVVGMGTTNRHFVTATPLVLRIGPLLTRGTQTHCCKIRMRKCCTHFNADHIQLRLIPKPGLNVQTL